MYSVPSVGTEGWDQQLDDAALCYVARKGDVRASIAGDTAPGFDKL